MDIEFHKMDGLGNDFVIIDNRNNNLEFPINMVRHLARRSNKVTKGCDQVIIFSKDTKADIFMDIFNSDGSIATACGNATRCVAWLYNRKENISNLLIRTRSEFLKSKTLGDIVSVDMGKPKFSLEQIPASQDIQSFNFAKISEKLTQYHLVNVGNPHIVFFVDTFEGLDIEQVGKKVQKAKKDGNFIFPQGINVNFAKKIDEKTIELTVYERGAGLTMACGTGACATGVIGIEHFGLSGSVDVIQKGGTLNIRYSKENSIVMTGSVNYQFQSSFSI